MKHIHNPTLKNPNKITQKKTEDIKCKKKNRKGTQT